MITLTFCIENVTKKGASSKKINLNCVRAYIDSLDWIKSKEATINHNNNGDKCFQYAVTACIKFWRNWKKVKLKKDKIKIHRDTMTGKDSIKKSKSCSECFICWKRKCISHICFKTQPKAWKTNYSINHFKSESLTLSFGKKVSVLLR